MNDILKIGIIGTGNMGSAILGGIIRSHIAEPGNVFAFDVDMYKLDALCNEFKINKCASNEEIMLQCTHIILAVKPQNMRQVLTEIAPAVTDKHCMISVAAGIRTAFIEELTGKETRVVRTMPNTPALIGVGATAIAPGAFALPEDLEIAESIFKAVGIVIQIEEEHLNAITALSGSGPAYFFHLIECLIDAGVKVGIPEKVAEQLVKQTALGAARLAIDSPDTPAELRRKVTSPGGTTEAALKVFAKHNFPEMIAEAIQDATDRARELSSKA